ncbi:MAG TPA: ABC transporter substrate-binding protein [Clostridiaceae bacterium]|nr:ABC transporter substrate-binding protein [Clostridiaceae bacterium]
MKKTLLILVVILSLAIITVGCSKAKTTENDNQQAEKDSKEIGLSSDKDGTDNPENSDLIRIGVLQLLAHDSLDAAREGFIDHLDAGGYREGKEISILVQNAFGEQANLKSMAEKLLRECDLVLAITTPAAQTIAGLSPEIPILFTAVTDPVDAGLVDSLSEPGGNITGTSDQAPVDQQVLLLLSLAEMENVGLIYNAGEPNSVIQAEEAKAEIEKAGKNVVALTVASTNDVQQAMTTLVSKVDGIYIPTDNTMASTAAASGTIAMEAGIPIVAGSIDHTSIGGTATIGISYYDLGAKTAQQALAILSGDKKAAEIPVALADDLDLYINEEYAEAIGINPDTIELPRR